MNDVARVAKTSALAVWSLILGILSLLCFGIFAGIPAIICGHMGRAKIKQSQGKLIGGGMALAGLIMGYIGAVIVSIFTIGIVAAIAIPNFIAYKQKAFCSITESEAMNAMAAVSCYFADPDHETVPTMAQLASDPECEYFPGEDAEVYIEGNIEQIQITAVDTSGRCPRGQQYVLSTPESMNDGWQ
jgi:hypothetical protein